jgi:hypothetical protein
MSRFPGETGTLAIQSTISGLGEGGIDVSMNAIYMVSDIPDVTDFSGMKKDSRGVEKVECHDLLKNMMEITVAAMLFE